MSDTDWALVRDDGAPSTTLADLIGDAIRDDPASPTIDRLLTRWSAFVAGCTPLRAFAATADNIGVRDGEFHLACDLREGVEPLDADATAARLCWHLARVLVTTASVDDPFQTVDALATRLSGRSGLMFSAAGLARAKAHDVEQAAAIDGRDPATTRASIETLSNATACDLAEASTLPTEVQRRALVNAWTQLRAVRADRDRAEGAAVELAATRALAQSLGEELERDEWIRARLRNAKSTKPALAVIAARKRILNRP